MLHVVTAEQAGERTDVLVAALSGASRSAAAQSAKHGDVLVNGLPAKPSQQLEAGDVLVFTIAERAPLTTTPERLALDILYEDEDIIVINKPAGMVTHPAHGATSGTLVNAVLAHTGTLPGDAVRPGLVHRLDRDTSGLLVVAKDAASHVGLARQMKEHTTVKRYLALVEGQMPVPEGVIEAPIGRDPRYRQRMAIVRAGAGGREARTRFRVLRYAKGRSLLEMQLETGRTHQIRVHLAAVQHPVVGDAVYGRPQPPRPPRQFLHAAHLELAHPTTGEWLVFDVPLPPDLAAFQAEWER